MFNRKLKVHLQKLNLPVKGHLTSLHKTLHKQNLKVPLICHVMILVKARQMASGCAAATWVLGGWLRMDDEVSAAFIFTFLLFGKTQCHFFYSNK